MTVRPRFMTRLWDGVYSTDFTLETLRQRSYRVGQELLQRGWSCLVAYDTRFMSNLFAQDMYNSLENQGVAVTLATTPAALPAVQWSLAGRQDRCALMVSARNRPYWYNGLVLVEPAAPGSLLDATGDEANQTIILPETLYDAPFPTITSSTVQGNATEAEHTFEVRGPYLDMVRNLVDVSLIRSATLTIFTDPMNGTVAGCLPAIIGEGNYTKAVEINREYDPLFSKITPLPHATGLARLRKLVRESDSNIGLAFSADGSALGVVDKNGEQLDPLEVALLLAHYLVRRQRQRGVVVAPPPAEGSPLQSAVARLSTWEEALGFRVELAENAARRIAEMTAQENNNLLVGCTDAGELVLSRYSSYPDALIAGLLMIEMVARHGGNLRTAIDDVRSRLAVAS